MILPSKELISEVLSKEVEEERFIDSNSLTYVNSGIYEDINIYEFAFKCKEWALRKGFEVRSSSMLNSDEGMRYWTQLRDVHGNDSLRICTVYADTEPEAVFKATSYIMEQLKQKD